FALEMLPLAAERARLPLAVETPSASAPALFTVTSLPEKLRVPKLLVVPSSKMLPVAPPGFAALGAAENEALPPTESVAPFCERPVGTGAPLGVTVGADAVMLIGPEMTFASGRLIAVVPAPTGAAIVAALERLCTERLPAVVRLPTPPPMSRVE